MESALILAQQAPPDKETCASVHARLEQSNAVDYFALEDNSTVLSTFQKMCLTLHLLLETLPHQLSNQVSTLARPRLELVLI